MDSHPKSNLDSSKDPTKAVFSREKRKHRFDQAHFFILAGTLLALVFILDMSRLEKLELFGLDRLFRTRPPIPISEKLQIIEIDDESIEAIGDWPWPANYHIQLIDILSRQGAKAIIFEWALDVTDEDEGLKKLIKSFQHAGNVYFPIDYKIRPEKKIWVHALPIVLQAESEEKVWRHTTPELEQAARGTGHQIFEEDSDGVIRRIPLARVQGGEEQVYLGLRVVLDLSDSHNKNLLWEEFSHLKTNELIISWPDDWQRDFKTISYADIIRSDQASKQGLAPLMAPELFKDKICLIGMTAKDYVTSLRAPTESFYPQLGIHAALINGFETHQYIRKMPELLQFAWFLLVGIAVILILVLCEGALAISLMGGLVLLHLGLVAGLFWIQGYWFFIFHPLLAIACLLLISTIYERITSSHEQQKLYALATRDGLTGLYVIRHFREVLNQTVVEVQESREPISIILFDIDNFKKINDTHGHPAGDMVLKRIAEILLMNLRQRRPVEEIDFIARYGGEEFIIMLRGIPINQAASKVAERVRRLIQDTEFVWKETLIPVTVSLGVSTLYENESIPDAMVHRADEALYQAKRQGKNRVCTKTLSLS